MKSILFFACLILSLQLATSQQETGVTIQVTIDNVLNDTGKVIVSLHTTETFMRGAGIANQEQSIQNGKVQFIFENVQPGVYAIMALHDENENNRMDFDSSGMPKESYGMSGNDMVMGPPSFENAKFEVGSENLEFNIRF